MSNPSKTALLEIHHLPRENFWENLKPFLGTIDISELDSEDYRRHLDLDIDTMKWMDREEQIGNINVEKELMSYLESMLSVRIFEGMKIDNYLNQAIIFRTYKIPHVEAHKAVTEKYSQEFQGNSKSQESQGSSKPQGFQRNSKPQESIYDQKILGAPLMLEGYKWPMFTNESGKTYPMSFYAQFFDPTKPLQTEFIQIFVSDLSDIENACMGTKVIHIRKIPLMDILCKKPVESYFKDGEIDEDKLTVYILNGKEIKLPNTNLEVHEKMKEKSMKRGYDEKLPTNVSGKIVKWNLVYTCADEDCDDIPEEVTEICEDYYFYMQNDISTLLQVGGINNSCQRNVYEETYYHCIYNYYYADGGSLSTTETGETYGDSC